MPPLSSAPVSALPTDERVLALDVLRGVAISGILLVNIGTFSGYDFLTPLQATALSHQELDRWVHLLIGWFIHAKFYSIFALLFGIGFALFMTRLEARARPARRLFRRRLVGLFIIGLTHSILLWFGDILAIYALLGFLLIPFWRVAPGTLLRVGLVVVLSPIALHGIWLLAHALTTTPGSAAAAGSPPAALVQALEAFRSGGYLQVVQANLLFTVVGFVARRVLQMQVLRIFGMFLLGLYVVRSGLLTPSPARSRLLRRVLWGGLVLGLPLSFATVRLAQDTLLPLPTVLAWLATTLDTLSALALSLAYASGVVLAVERSPRARLVSAFATAGRMALTNYLFQTLACIVIFYGLGLGLFQQIGLAAAAGIAMGIVLVELFASHWWLRRFRQGPIEWCWRQFTYGRAVIPAAA